MPNLGDLCICGHTREIHFGRECSVVAGMFSGRRRTDCPCKQFVEGGLEAVLPYLPDAE
jgi:hypothetical protein